MTTSSSNDDDDDEDDTQARRQIEMAQNRILILEFWIRSPLEYAGVGGELPEHCRHIRQLHCEEPQVLDSHLKQDTQLTFIDFIPSITKRSSTSIISSNEIEYHSFRKMIERANEWLKENPNYDLINCETIKIFFKYNDTQNYYDLRFNDVSHYIYGTEKNNLLKALRLWIKRKECDIDETINNESTTANVDAGYATDSLSPVHTPQQESPKLSELTAMLKRRWTQPQQQFQKVMTTKSAQTKQSRASNQSKLSSQVNEPHSTDHSPKKSAFQQQQAFRLQQYSSQSKFFLNKLQRQASCPQSNSLMQSNHTNAQTNVNQLTTQNSPAYHHAKQSHNSINQSQHQSHSHQVQSQQQQQQQQVNNQLQSPPSNLTKTKTVNNPNPIILNYVDIIPECNEIVENSKLEKFERLDDCLNKLNDLIRNGQIKGRIVSVETSTCEATVEWKIDTERSFTAITSKNVNFLRCFYLENENSEIDQQIKIMDFIPDHLSGGGFFKKPKFENFSLIFPKVTEWLTNNSKCKFKNAQTLDIKLKCYVSQNQELIDTKSMSFTEHGDYLRILRLVYMEQANLNQSSINEQFISINESINNLLDTHQIEDEECSKNEIKNGVLIKQDSDTSGQSGSNDLSKSTKDSNLDKEIKCDESNESRTNGKSSIDSIECENLVMKLREFSTDDKRPIYLTSKLFLSQRKGQTINDLKQEIQDWFKNYQLDNNERKNTAELIKPKIVACETMQIFCKQDDLTNLQKAAEETFMYNRFGSKNGYVVNVFRVYFDLGWFAFERLGYGLKLSQAQKMRKKRLNYSTSVDEEHLKESSIRQPVQKRMLSRRESVGEFFKDRIQDQADQSEFKAKASIHMRRRSCIVHSFEKKSPVDDQTRSVNRSTDRSIEKSTDRSIDRSTEIKNTEQIDDKLELVNNKLTIADSRMNSNADVTCLDSEFSSLSMLANVSEMSKLKSSNNSLGTLTATNEDQHGFLNQLDEKLSLNLRRKLRNSIKHQSIENQENANCLLM